MGVGGGDEGGEDDEEGAVEKGLGFGTGGESSRRMCSWTCGSVVVTGARRQQAMARQRWQTTRRAGQGFCWYKPVKLG